MDRLWQDLRYGMRGLLRNPGFTAVAVLVLSLGIGANSAMFTLVNALLLRPVVGENPGQLLGCYSKDAKIGSFRPFSYPNYIDLRERNSSFAQLAAHDVSMVGLAEGERTRRVFADFVSSNYFAALGVRPALGRDFAAIEEKPGSAIPVVIITYEFWKKAGKDPGLLGKTLTINGRPHTVIGIAPASFTGTTAVFGPELYLPLGLYDALVNESFSEGKGRLAQRNNHRLMLVGRLIPGVTAARAESELAVIAAQMAKAYPLDNKDQTYTAHALSRTSISTEPQDNGQLTAAAVLLISVSSVVLLIACLNLANMLLARGGSRRKEFAIRIALGAGRARILRQLLTEGLILSLLGGIAGMLLAWWGIQVLVSSMTAFFPIHIVIRSSPDPRVFAALLIFCVSSTVVSGLGPALKVSRPDVVVDIKEHAGENVVGARRSAFSRRNLLVVAQISLSLVLLVAAGLFIRGALRAQDVNPGFSLDNGIIVELDPSLAGYEEIRGRGIYLQVVERLRMLPGVDAVGLARTAPFGMISNSRQVHRAEDARDPADQTQARAATSARFNAIGTDYFAALGLRMVAGRAFSRSEEEGSSTLPAAIVDELLAKRLWPQDNPLGKGLHFGSKEGEQPDVMQVVGIAPSIREELFEHAPQPHVYVPFGRNYQADANIHVRLVPGNEKAQSAMLQAVRREIVAVDPGVPVLALKTLRAHVGENVELWIIRTGARLFSIFGALAVFLAVIGVYGLQAYTVARRTREIGIRISLGATTNNVLWLILSEGIRLTAAGVGIGLLLAFGTARLLSGLLYEVSPTDPVIFLATPILLAGAALLACYLPALRAARVQPVAALRHE